jgi:hypothetical protein
MFADERYVCGGLLYCNIPELAVHRSAWRKTGLKTRGLLQAKEGTPDT